MKRCNINSTYVSIKIVVCAELVNDMTLKMMKMYVNKNNQLFTMWNSKSNSRLWYCFKNGLPYRRQPRHIQCKRGRGNGGPKYGNRIEDYSSWDHKTKIIRRLYLSAYIYIYIRHKTIRYYIKVTNHSFRINFQKVDQHTIANGHSTAPKWQGKPVTKPETSLDNVNSIQGCYTTRSIQ